MSDVPAAEVDSLDTRIAASMALHWPELSARLAAKLGDFIAVAMANAATHRIVQPSAVARFVNVCCAFGPGFENKPQNEWALAILADERLGEWVRLHQLVVRAATELKRRVNDGRAVSAQLLRADGAMLDDVDAGRKALDSDAAGLPRLACDLEAVDLRLLEVDWRREYRKADDGWQPMAVPEAATSIRVGPGRAAPAQLCLLTHAPKDGPPARFQVRLLTHAICDQDHHPRVVFAGDHGLSSWQGHTARAVSWQVVCRAQGPATNGLGVTLLEETTPQASLLRVETCGLRDEGVPTGSIETYVWAYPAEQWLFVWQREAGPARQWPRPPDAAPNPGPASTRCRIERDGVVVASAAWAKALRETLELELERGFDRLFAAWQSATTASTMSASAGLLSGRATLTWGWREGPDGLAGLPLLRVLGELDLGHPIAISLAGELVLGVTRTRVRLIVEGDAPMQRQFAREHVAPGLFEELLAATVRWRLDYRLEFDPVAVDEAAVVSSFGRCTGALVGESGLRPCVTGGSGWQWYTRLETEAVSVPLNLHDPVLGQTRRTLALLPAIKLVDWSLG